MPSRCSCSIWLISPAICVGVTIRGATPARRSSAPCSTAHWRSRNGLPAIMRAPDAFRSALTIVELLGLRAGPGLINAATLILLGIWLSVPAYGQYSTVVATTGLVANLLYGP